MFCVCRFNIHTHTALDGQAPELFRVLIPVDTGTKGTRAESIFLLGYDNQDRSRGTIDIVDNYIRPFAGELVYSRCDHR